MAIPYKKPTHIPLSYSKIGVYENCPYKFLMVEVQKRYPFQPTAATEKGNRLHKSFEEFIRDDKPLNDEARAYAPLLNVLKRQPGNKHVEMKMCLNWNCEPVDYFRGKNIWLRGQFDLMIERSETEATIFDYKTGSSKYPKPDQLEAMAMMTFHYFPKLQEIKGGLLFIEDNISVKDVFIRDKLPEYIQKWQDRSIPIMQSLATDDWPAKGHGNPLCRFCPVMECSYRGQYD